jgi:hypothetical protein
MRCNLNMPPSSNPATWADFAQLLVMLALPAAVLMTVRCLNRRPERLPAAEVRPVPATQPLRL